MLILRVAFCNIKQFHRGLKDQSGVQMGLLSKPELMTSDEIRNKDRMVS